MTGKNLINSVVRVFTVTSLAVASCAASASAATMYWTDWTDSNNSNGFTGFGTITTPTSTVKVTYNNPQGISFYQSSGGTDFWTNRAGVRNPATSPYTSSAVDNIPTGTDIIALKHVGSQTLTFSKTIANPVFSFVSLNLNGYAFLNQDFEILSFGHPSDGNDCGYWGCGLPYKEVVDLGNGNVEYRLLSTYKIDPLLGTDEPHGTIRFKGAFDSLTWRSLTNENWNGFTVGVQGTAAEVFPPTKSVPEPTSIIALLGLGTLGATSLKRKQKQEI